MALVIELEAVVQPDGKIEITSPELVPGQRAKVMITVQSGGPAKVRHVLDIVADLPGHVVFKNAEEVDAYIREERDSWASSPRT
jgi:hypothetical protein